MSVNYVVYFIQEGKSGPVKVGHAKNVKKRLSELQIGNPKPLTLVAEVCGLSKVSAESLERSLHSYLRRYRMRGEWFRREILDAQWFSVEFRFPTGAVIRTYY